MLAAECVQTLLLTPVVRITVHTPWLLARCYDWTVCRTSSSQAGWMLLPLVTGHAILLQQTPLLPGQCMPLIASDCMHHHPCLPAA